jgi:hypothetical protein
MSTKTSKKNLATPKRGAEIIIFDVKAEYKDKRGGIIEAGIGEKILRVFGIEPAHVTVEKMQDNMANFVSNMQRIIDKSSSKFGQYKIDTVEVDARVTADGQIGLMGTHLGMSGEAGIKFNFKRRG